jgi:hypothetical protein
MNIKKFLLINLGIALLLIIGTEPVFGVLNKGALSGYEESFLEPVFFWSLSLFIASAVLSLFNPGIFTRWFNTFFKWGVPIGLVITFLMEPEVSYSSISRTGMAMLLGEILIVSTLIFALVQKFHFKR